MISREKSNKSLGLSTMPVSLKDDRVVRTTIESIISLGKVECRVFCICQEEYKSSSHII